MHSGICARIECAKPFTAKSTLKKYCSPWCSHREYVKKYGSRNSETYDIDRYRDRAQKGICIKCPKMTKNGHKLCESCQIKHNTRSRTDRQKLRDEIIQHYGSKCSCCEERRCEFLSVDHINGDGGKTRKDLTQNGAKFYRWIKKSHFPDSLRLLCHNCNISRGLYGYCPHEKELASAS